VLALCLGSAQVGGLRGLGMFTRTTVAFLIRSLKLPETAVLVSEALPAEELD
jgi:hypothetical protein